MSVSYALFSDLFEIANMAQLKYRFEATDITKSSERRKARIKNINLPILQYWYNGDPMDPLRCLGSGEPGWREYIHPITGEVVPIYSLEFNHIRQRNSYLINEANGELSEWESKYPGVSIDKGEYAPSALFRDSDLTLSCSVWSMIEFMAIIPVCRNYHKFITNCSMKNHITLNNFKHAMPWGLQSKRNFDTFWACTQIKNYKLNLDYLKVKELLCDINRDNIVAEAKAGNLT